jgi:hypothetical protein
VFCVAKETGWREEEILNMPLKRLLCYYHAALVSSGAWTTPLSASADSQIQDLLSFADTLPDFDTF